MDKAEIARFIGLIFKWQTLVGSILGGMFALGTALIVARSARRRDEQAAGMIALATLAPVQVTSKTLAALSSRDGVTEDKFPIWFAEMVAHARPSVSSLFDSSAARLMSVDVSLAAHLSLFQQTYSQAESVLKRIADDRTYYHMHGKLPRPQDLMKADCYAATKHFQYAAEHANPSSALCVDL
jgi:hypothetical protein